MPDILHDLPVTGTASRVYDAVSLPTGLDAWWTEHSSGRPEVGSTYELDFGSGHRWRGVVTRGTPEVDFELAMTSADTDWTGTRVGFRLEEKNGTVLVRFHHRGWARENGHFRTSAFCWAMYLRLLKRYVELGEIVPYAGRLGA